MENKVAQNGKPYMTEDELSEGRIEYTGTTDTLNAFTSEKLSADIISVLGEGYNTQIYPYSKEKPELGYYVSLWTKRSSPRFEGDIRDEIVTTFSSSRQWYLFKQAACVVTAHKDVQEFENWLNSHEHLTEVIQ